MDFEAERIDACDDALGSPEGRAAHTLAEHRALIESIARELATTRAMMGRLQELAEQLSRVETIISPASASAQMWDNLNGCPALLVAEQDGKPRLQADHAMSAKEHLAKMAAQLAGRHPDEKVTVSFAGYVVFNDHAWRYPDFVQRAERAFAELAPTFAANGTAGSLSASQRKAGKEPAKSAMERRINRITRRELADEPGHSPA
jgi:hypothetical protein